MSPHLDTDALADVLAGLEAGAGQPDHLDECTSCQAALAELGAAVAKVTVTLAELPDPKPPEGLTSRIEAALAALAPAPAAAVEARTPAPLTPLPAATITPTHVSRSGPPRWLKAAGGLSAAAALVVGVVLVVNSRSGGSGSRDSATSAAAIARNNTGAAYTKDAATLSGNLAALLKGDAPAAAAPMLAGEAVPEAATPSGAADSRAKTNLSTVDPLAPLRGSTALAACLASLSDPGDPGVPLALDYGTFEGQPALLVLLPGGKASSVLAFFVGPQCNQQDSHLLYYEKVAAP